MRSPSFRDHINCFFPPAILLGSTLLLLGLVIPKRRLIGRANAGIETLVGLSILLKNRGRLSRMQFLRSPKSSIGMVRRLRERLSRRV